MGSDRADISTPAIGQDNVRSWEHRAPWYRRVSARTGLQGKLVLGFMLLLTLTTGSALWLFMTESRAVLDRVMDEQSRAVSQTLAMASETPLGRQDLPELNRMARDLLRNRDLVAIAFYGPEGQLLTVATQGSDLEAARAEMLPNPKDQMGELMVAHKRHSPRLGQYVQVTAPVTSARYYTPSGRPVGSKMVGYVSLCFSPSEGEQHLARVGHLLILIGGVAALISLPLVYVLVHRIFQPIRQLVAATDRIASGDLDAEVAVDRPDVIGTLARSFNEMVQKVRRQQGELASTNAALANANTQLAEANEQLEHANHELEGKVAQRTVQLEAANKRLRSEIAEKEDFLRAVSHDLNAPLRNISGMATMLLMKHRASFEDDIINRLERIQKNVQVETDLIAELLELSRIKTRRLKLEPVDLDALVREAGGVFDHDFKRTGITFHLDTPLPRLHCERARLRQVFQNLIDNAVKYMGDGPVKEIRVGCVVRADEAEFYVKDTGIGIDPEDLDKVFYVFRRGKNAAAHGVTGKGVGLASVKSIVETYNGSLWVQSEVGKGSTFRFTINGQYVLPNRPDPNTSLSDPAQGGAADGTAGGVTPPDGQSKAA